MSDLGIQAPNYRRAQQRWPNAPTLLKCYDGLDNCYGGNGHGLVEHVKSFIETVCLTIMGELREPMPSSTPSTTDLLIAALGPLGLRNTRGASKLDKVLSGFNRLADAVTEMRNDHGPIAHGKDGFLDAVTTDHARAFLHTGDAIIGLLLTAFEGKQPDLTATREPYERFPHLNDRIDKAVSLQARIDEDGENPMVVFSVSSGSQNEPIELRVEPSRLLYGIDRAAYIEVLKTAEPSVGKKEETKEPPGGAMPLDDMGGVPRLGTTVLTEPLIIFVSTYNGIYATLRHGIKSFLIAEGLKKTNEKKGKNKIIDSLLATAEQNMGLDWKKRETLQARLRVAIKRVLVHFGLPTEKSEIISGHLIAWFRVQVRDGDLLRMAPPQATSKGTRTKGSEKAGR